MSEVQGGGAGGQRVVADVGEMLVAAQQIDNSREVLGDILGQLRTIVGRSSDVWSSDSNDMFGIVMADWDKASRNMNDALEEIAAGIRTSGNSYDQAVEDQARAIADVGSTLKGSYT
ncbi:WXG100 family type VII secretion target [Rhodococcus zopfii]|uniref:WXG100 family type VII secretion target n=1 Tax=Rhodococcus zopfii TaxID=43772 RepID=A0ABU3WLA2_9NOCA|nr:WXG100 family type VII secretion target [Rhodococcus zopfii]MDV2474752.1 WXG100 family type VII secretion target [Rhodococcus zopfii]